jgi:transcriptional antiterminator Rof (Rho-off)
MLKGISVLCLCLLSGAVFGWFFAFASLYLSSQYGASLRRIYLDVSKHFLIALTIAVTGFFTFVLGLILFLKGGGLYGIPFHIAVAAWGIAVALFLNARAVKIIKTIIRVEMEEGEKEAIEAIEALGEAKAMEVLETMKAMDNWPLRTERIATISRDDMQNMEDRPQRAERFETISYGSKRFQFSCLAFVIVLLVLLVIG